MTSRRCWNCDVVAHMTVGEVVKIGEDGAEVLMHATFTCDECGHMQFAKGRRPPPTGQAWSHNVKNWFSQREEHELSWYPVVGSAPAFPDVPIEIADAASEAHRCWSIQAYRGATALARAVIEASAKAKGITKGQLFDKIEALEKAGHIRGYVREAAHEVRHLGNEVAHGDFVDPVEAEEAEEILALMGEVLLEVFQSPARVARVKAAREAKKAARTTDR